MYTDHIRNFMLFVGIFLQLVMCKRGPNKRYTSTTSIKKKTIMRLSKPSTVRNARPCTVIIHPIIYVNIYILYISFSHNHFFHEKTQCEHSMLRIRPKKNASPLIL
ncbi:hypothetical protein F4824DRAFT_454684 [Ustulina deusta]|nr:hypothetical protein F4824DRAFT_454684 [Ustulina deusta]